MGVIVYRKSEEDTEHLIIVSTGITRHRVKGGELLAVDYDLCPIETAELLQREQDDWTLEGKTFRTAVKRWRIQNITSSSSTRGL